MSFIYIKTEPRLWTTGHYDPDGKFHPDDDFGSPEEAADRCAMLNGDKSDNERLESIERSIQSINKKINLIIDAFNAQKEVNASIARLVELSGKAMDLQHKINWRQFKKDPMRPSPLRSIINAIGSLFKKPPRGWRTDPPSVPRPADPPGAHPKRQP